MGKRRRGGIAEFFQGFNEGYNTVGKVLSDMEMRKIANAQQDTQTTLTEKGAPDPERYTYDEDTGQYVPSLKAVESGQADGMQPVRPSFDNKTQTQFLGKTYDKQMTPGQENSARLMAMSGVLGKFGNPMDAARLSAAANELEVVERKRADDEALRSALSGGEPATTTRETRRTSTEAQAGSIGTGADLGQAGAVPEHKPVSESGSLPTSAALTPAQVAQGGLPQPKAAQPKQPSRSDLDGYLQNVAPKAMDVLIRQGRLEEAKRFRDFLDSENGRSYATAWLKGVRLHAIGDDNGALAAWQDLYNRQLYDDGRTAKLTPMEDGKQTRIEFFDTAGNLVGKQVLPTNALASQAALALEPTKAVEFHAQQTAQRAKESATLDRQIQLEQLRQEGQEVREDRRDARLVRTLEARTAKGQGGLTTAQQRTNDSILAAREQLAGMTQEEVLRRTQSTTATGRANPDYDPQLARTAKLANQRFYGDDPAHDEFTAARQQQTQQANAQAEAVKRFRADRAMDNFTIGKELHTIKDGSGREVTGYPVKDRTGKIIGVFQ